MEDTRHRLLAAAAGFVLAAAVCLPPVSARTTLVDVAVASLPAQARDVLAQIRSGGPFRYERDGVVFGNREHLLPSKPRGHYHEYTVPTPGASDRGARRIVCGGAKRTPDVCYYSDDHYASFRRIRE